MTDEQDPGDAHDTSQPLSIAQLDAAAEYHAPPRIIPRDAMWNAIQQQRRLADVDGSPSARAVRDTPPVPVHVTHTTRRALPRLPRWLAVVASAAVVVVAVTLARRAPVHPGGPALGAADTAPGTVAWQVASTEHFGLAESMLTTLATSSEVQGDKQLTAWSRDLLESTRLLLDSPAGRDPKRRALLLDLELVLVQLVETGPTMRTEDRSVMDELLSRSALLLTRIRTNVPAGTPASPH